jgi:hypothetical protein
MKLLKINQELINTYLNEVNYCINQEIIII